MQVVGTAGQGSLKPLLALIRDTVAVGVGKFPDARWGSDVKRSVMPESSLRKHKAVGEDSLAIEDSVTVDIDETDDTPGVAPQLRELDNSE